LSAVPRGGDERAESAFADARRRFLAPDSIAQDDTAHRATRGVATILLPARNEEDGIATTLRELPLPVLAALGFDVDLLVVDGASEDATREIARDFGARVVLQPGVGKGLAFRAALDHAKGTYVVMLDADGTYPAEDVPRFLLELEDGADVVMGSRFAGEIEDGAMSTVNRVGNVALSTLATLLYGVRTTDVCTGMWGFRREKVAALPLTARRFEIEAELFAQCAKAGLVIRELPIRYGRRIGETKLGRFKDGIGIGAKLVGRRLG